MLPVLGWIGSMAIHWLSTHAVTPSCSQRTGIFPASINPEADITLVSASCGQQSYILSLRLAAF